MRDNASVTLFLRPGIYYIRMFRCANNVMRIRDCVVANAGYASGNKYFVQSNIFVPGDLPSRQ